VGQHVGRVVGDSRAHRGERGHPVEAEGVASQDSRLVRRSPSAVEPWRVPARMLGRRWVTGATLARHVVLSSLHAEARVEEGRPRELDRTVNFSLAKEH
jgi:hypothetical protein